MSGKGRLFCSCWPVSPHTPLNTTGIVNAFGYLLEHDVKAVVKDTAFLGHRMWRNSKLVLTWKLHDYWMPFRVLEGDTHTSREKSNQF